MQIRGMVRPSDLAAVPLLFAGLVLKLLVVPAQVVAGQRV